MASQRAPFTVLNDRDRRENVFTLIDGLQRLWTVVNVPHTICIPEVADPHMRLNKSHHDLLMPQYAANQVPEAAFLLRAMPFGDPLLGSLCYDKDKILPEKHGAGYRVPEQLQDSWRELERGLIYVSDALFERAGCRAASDVRACPFWDTPTECGYQRLFPHVDPAQRAMRRSRDAMLLLAARCSLAIAIWQFEPTRREHDAVADEVPPWIRCLHHARVDQTWIDALQCSIVSDFSDHGVRVGTCMNVRTCEWPTMVPILRRAHVPLFLRWQCSEVCEHFAKSFPSQQDLIPTDANRALAVQYPPRGSQTALVYRRQVIWHPDHQTPFDDPPHGPYQLSGESLELFLSRRSRRQASLLGRETSQQRDRRLRREIYVNSHPHPHPRSRLFIWVKVGDVYPDLKAEWLKLDYRLPCGWAASGGLWLASTPTRRHYNSIHDEWDVELMSTDQISQALTEAVSSHLSYALHPSEHVLDSGPPDFYDTNPPIPAPPGPLHNEGAELLGECPQSISIKHDAQRYVADWYGIRSLAFSIAEVTDEGDEDFSSVARLLGLMYEDLPVDKAQRINLKKTVEVLGASHQDRHLMLQQYWDLDPRNVRYLLNHLQQETLPVVKEIRSVQSGCDVCYELLYAEDPPDQGWRLVVGPSALLYLLRCHVRQPIMTSGVGVVTLLGLGIPMHTIVRTSNPSPMIPLPLRARRLQIFRPHNQMPTTEEYGEYVQRVVALLHMPHIRAGFAMGGIIWRLLLEAIGDDEDLHEMFVRDVALGPLSSGHSQQQVVEGNGVDDALSAEELDIISGVYKVYTEQSNQTADHSWWPKHQHWVNAGGYTGIWTPWQEKWFSDRMMQIVTGTAKTRTGREWKDAMKGRRECSALARTMEGRNVDFIRQCLT